MSIGMIISENRKKLGLTQEALAQQLGVTNQAVSKWESDQSCPDILLLPRIADIFGITMDALFGREIPGTEHVAPVPPAAELPWADDDTLRVVVYRGHTYLADCPEQEKITFEYKGPALNVECAVNLACNDVNGNVRADGNVSCDDVHGDVHARGNVACDDVEGNVEAGGSVSCDSVDGNVSAGGNVTCDEIEGDVSAGGNVICDEISGSAAAGGSVSGSNFHFTSGEDNGNGENEAITEKVQKFVNDILSKKGIDFRL